MEIAEITTIAAGVLAVVLIGVTGFVVLGVYRARHSAAREAGYRTLAEQAAAAQTDAVAAARDTNAELKALRAELGQVTARLAALEKLLSQVG